MEILHQLGELFLQSVPTIIIVFLFYLVLRVTFFKPLDRVLTERRARTEGARRAAESAQAAAQEKQRAYNDALQKARSEVYAEQEAARRAVLDERAGLIRTTRTRSGETIRAAKEMLGADLAAARTALEADAQSLAGEIARAILEPRPSRGPAASEAR
jgi:F-type H+-transporting ATPase subunit b